MLKQGTRVTELTKKAGQVPRKGMVVTIRGTSVEVEWEDGHTSITSRAALVAVKKGK